jgi:uncharacterized protein YdiU (UPF0061 family)
MKFVTNIHFIKHLIKILFCNFVNYFKQMPIQFLHKFTTNLPSDPIEENFTRQVNNAAFSYVKPKTPSHPKLIHLAKEVQNLIGFSDDFVASETFLNLVSGAEIVGNAKPFAMNYAGHQFGNWAGQLGDGRAIVLGEIEHNNQLFTLQLKGAGPTPYSRRADGLAVLRSSIREHLCSEAMFHLGVPTTRSLSLVSTGDEVVRDVMYDGNAALEKGAIVCRIAPSFIRFGSFELLSSQNDIENLKLLADYTITNYYPEINSLGKEKYLAFFKTVAEKTRELLLHWQRVGFVHGVMNTDNMSIHGITIDYGPYGWLEDYNPNWTPNTTDAAGKRYRFGNQSNIALWNLYQLANALYPLIEEAGPLEEILNDYAKKYDEDFLEMMLKKLGITLKNDENENLIQQLLYNLEQTETDYTIFFRNLNQIEKTDTSEACVAKITEAFYKPEEVTGIILETWHFWFAHYVTLLNKELLSDNERKTLQNSVNPKYVLRNYMAQMAIELSEKEDYSLLNELYKLLLHPYEEQPEFEKWFAKRPDWARQKIGSSMLSCSS